MLRQQTTGEVSLTVERLREALHYNPETGIFAWRISPTSRVRAGDVAGWRTGNGYFRISLDGHRYRAHRLDYFYMTGVWPVEEIDHKNTDRSNNRWQNLREATRTQNNQNSTRQKNNISGLKGISQHGRQWRAEITANGERVSLGSFGTPEDAACAYATAAERLHGRFARFDLVSHRAEFAQQLAFDFGGSGS